MSIFLAEADVETLATMALALDSVEEAFRLQGMGEADNAPRRRNRLQSGVLHVMSASLPTLGRAGVKTYTTVAGNARFLFWLYGEDGALLAVMEADKLGQLRTGAATGVATRYMARQSASRVGIFGTGWQARSQLEAICAVRSIKTIVAYSRDAERRAAFCAEMTEKLGVGVYPASTPEEAARDMDIVVTATTAKEPVLSGDWLARGAHVNAVGSNWLSRQEIDPEAVRRSACVIVDSIEQARLESGDLEKAAQAGVFFWEDARELGSVVVGECPGREDDAEITLFESHGIALEDVTLAAKVYEKAVAAGAGKPNPF
jgi:ornithine cyclodeaminase/alanine dehydrogenase-like protein (mu-crystallin family)